MGTGASACNCMRTMKRARLASHHDSSLPTSCWEYSQRESLRIRRHAHATYRATSRPQISLNSRIATVAAAGPERALRTRHAPSLWAYPLPTNIHNVRRFFTSTSSSHAVAANSDQEPEDTSHSFGSLDSKAIETLIFDLLRSEGRFVLHKKEGASQGKRFCSATLEIPNSDHKFSVQGRSRKRWQARNQIIPLLVLELKKAGIWEDLVQKRLESLGEGQVDVEPVNLKLADLDPVDVYQSLRYLSWFKIKNNWLIEDIHSRLPDGGFISFVTLRFHSEDSVRDIRTEGRGAKINLARQEALCKQIMKLKEIGIWYRLLEEVPIEKRRELDSLPGYMREASRVRTPETSSETSPTYSRETLVSSNTDLVKVLFSPEDPRPALDSEKTELLEIFQRMIETSALFHLDMETSGSFTCHVVLSMLDRNTVVEAAMSAPQEEEAKKMALLLLISKLQEEGLWEDLLHHTFVPPKAEVAINDDLFYNMQWVKHDLIQAEKSLRKTLSMQTTQATTQTTELESPPAIAPSYRKWRSWKLATSLAKFRELRDPQAVAVQLAQAILPVTDYREQILDLINKVTYSIVVAETGSGKSTQIPQMILENATVEGNGGDCKILCVQPRRLAAQLLARRVAHERCENIGDSVGYAVRFDASMPASSGSITYCTTGIMLNYMKASLGGMGQYTHILLDEVHVRDMGIDLVMLMLRRHVDLCRKLGKPAPKVVLMSATVDIERFSSYFRNEGPDGTLLSAPHISIPGRQYHVEKHYLSEVLESVRSSIRPGVLSSFLSDETTNDFLKRHRELFPVEDEMQLEARKDIDSLIQDLAIDLPDKKSRRDSLTQRSSTKPGSPSEVTVEDDVNSAIPHALIAATIFHLLQNTESGAILVFIPGMHHILELRRKLSTLGSMLNVDMTDTDRFRILSLHSALPEGHKELSEEIPEGCRRILLATDIAEASLTIPDVRYVIDSGRVNRAVYDNRKRCGRLECHWVSRSSALQRAGRAGRVAVGNYYFIGDQRLFESLPATTQPEFARGRLQEICLAAKTIAPDASLPDLLQQALDPPDEGSVRAAIDSLKSLKALDEHENITNLGRILALLPLPSTFGKLVLMGVIFRCLDPLLIIAAIGNGTEVFRLGFTDEEKRKVMRDRATFAGQSASDHIAPVRAVQAVQSIWLKEGHGVSEAFAASMSMYPDSNGTIYNVAMHILRVLGRERLIWSKKKPSRGSDSLAGREFNTNSHNIPLIKALLLHCLAPHIAAPVSRSFKDKYRTQTDENGVYYTRGNISLEPGKLPLALVTYSTKTEVAGSMKLNDVSLVSPLAACLFGGKLTWEDGSFMLNDWLKIGLNTKDVSISREEAATSMIELQAALDKSLTTMLDSLLLNTQAVTDHNVEMKMHMARQALNVSLEKAVTNVFNRDLYRLEPREDSMPVTWEAPELDDDFELDEEPVPEPPHGIQ